MFGKSFEHTLTGSFICYGFAQGFRFRGRYRLTMAELYNKT